METPEEFLMKYGICSDTTIGIEGDKKLTELLEEYANQALHIHNVSGRSEQCCSPTDGFYLGTTCPHCNKPFRKDIK